MLDRDFLKSLGIPEDRLPPPDLPADAPLAGPNGIPVQLLELQIEELEKLFKEVHTQANPYVFLMPNGLHLAAVFPEEAQGIYDLEYTAEGFMCLIVMGKAGYELTGYQTRDGRCHPTT